MSAAPEAVKPDELAFFFQTNEPIPARPLLDFLYEVERLASTRRYFGPDVVVEILEIVTGTKLARLSFNQKMTLGIAGAGLVVSVAHLGNDIAGRIQQPTGRLADSLARMCLDHGVAECVITTPEAQIHISRDDVKAILRLEERRAAADLLEAAPARSRGKLGRSEDQVLSRAYDDVGAILPARQGEGRVYTLLGRLRPPAGGSRDWQFTSQSGRDYIARGVNPIRANLPPDSIVVIRAEVTGREQGTVVLLVKDVFEPEDP